IGKGKTSQQLQNVEKPFFIKLVTGLQPGSSVPSVICNLNAELSEIDVVCRTADCWSAVNKTFMGITIHCSCMPKGHTLMMCWEKQTNVYKKFKIQNKIVCTMTDNAANFVKAFNCFLENVAIDAEPTVNTDEENDEGSASSENSDEEDGIEPVLLSVAYTLNLIARDTEMVTDRQYTTLSRPVFSKASALWNRCIKPTATQGLIACRPVIQKMTQSLPTRLECMLDKREHILAAILLPAFKLDWVEDEVKHLQYRAMLKQEFQSVHLADDSDQSQSCVDLDKKSTATSFFKFNRLKKLFIMYNTALPTSAPVERLFSTGGQIFRPRRNRLGDANFEKQLILNANKKVHKADRNAFIGEVT
uniref:HAT C-terminal dimerisation domain-containing protein n=1 Tax=Erpetoichthys calabaricus TaxID=27687 RepID=A0A8C4RJ19_ERPCA